LVRFGYDGTVFYGWAQQPGLRTVEGEIRRGLARNRSLTETGGIRLEVASRTDRGVSARANVLALQSPLPGPALLRSLNGVDPNIFFTAATEAPAGFRPRRATRRVYRYYEPRKVADPARMSEAASLFVGEIDVRSFGRAIPADVVTGRTVESVSLRRVSGGYEIRVSAPSFVWGMVRKIVGALHEVDEGRLTIPRLRAALEGSIRLTLPLAPPEPLVLWDVEYPIPWTFAWDGPNRGQSSARQQRADQVWVDRQRMAALPV
jgi:tRNA pseudouridine38-40 synthase